MTAVYARQSADRPDSISIDTQLEKCRACMTAAELADCRVYEDRGFSGKNTDRPAFQALLRDIESGLVQKLFAYKLDRVSRSVYDFAGLSALLAAKRVAFRSCEDGITLDDTPAGTALAQVMMVFAQFERETILRRVTDNYYDRARLGFYLGGRPPFGFAKGETRVEGHKTACFVSAPEQAALVCELYERYLEPDASLGTLMRWLNDEKRVPAARGTGWSTVQLGRLLRNPAYVRADAAVYRYLTGRGAAATNAVEAFTGVRGCYLYAPRKGRTRTKFADPTGAYLSLAPHEGFIDAAIWLRVQHKLDRGKALKNSGAGQHSWLSGLMKCEMCGYAISVVAKPAGRNGHYINCGGRKKGAAFCAGRRETLTLEQIEQAVEAELLAFLRSYTAVAVERTNAQTAEANRIEMQCASLDAELARLTRNLALVEQPQVVRALAAELDDKQRQAAALQQRQAELRRAPENADLQAVFAALPDEWAHFSIAQKKQLARIAVRRVTVGDGTITVDFAAPFGEEKHEFSEHVSKFGKSETIPGELLENDGEKMIR